MKDDYEGCGEGSDEGVMKFCFLTDRLTDEQIFVIVESLSQLKKNQKKIERVHFSFQIFYLKACYDMPPYKSIS